MFKKVYVHIHNTGGDSVDNSGDRGDDEPGEFGMMNIFMILMNKILSII